MLPMGYEARHKVSPLSRYPYDRTRAALAQLAAGAPLDPCHGAKMEYINPVDGGPVLRERRGQECGEAPSRPTR
jgi:gentisate 1,2-dioxygenase